MSNKHLRLLFLSTPVGPLGSGLGGGVELTLKNVVQELQNRGHKIKIVAPEKSVLGDLAIMGVGGEWQVTAQTQGRSTPIMMPENPVLGNMWEYARQVQGNYDLIFNIAYDWLPFYLTPFFQVPIAHFISMGSLNAALDEIMTQVAKNFPKTIGVYTKSQAETFPFADKCQCLGSAIDLSLYQFCSQPENALAWLGRIAPEKALEDAVLAAKITGIPLRVMGKIQDESYWEKVCQTYPDAPVEYLGFLSTEKLQLELGKCRALLMTPRWVEAFGNVAIEALACGVPVISYNRGGPGEIIQNGKTGFLVEPDNVDELVKAIAQIDNINRNTCRQQAEIEYSLPALGDRMEQWFHEILNHYYNQQS